MSSVSAIHHLITGGAGFIGSHLAEHLLLQGERVTVLDNLSTGRESNIEHLSAHANFRIVRGSVLDRELVEGLIEECDFVFHLAAAVGVQLIVERPVHTIVTNVAGSELVLSVAAANKRPLLLASTSEVYGKSEKLPFREDDDLVMGPTTRSRWAYACSKAIDEFLAIAYYREEGLPVTIVRLFNTVGPRQTGRYGMVLPRFVQQALAGQPILVYGDGKQTRCFGYVGDVVKAMARLSAEPRAVGQVFNVGNDVEMSVLELARMVREITGSNSPIQFVPYREVYGDGFEDMHRRVPCLDKIRSLLGHQPLVRPDAIVKLVADHFRRASVDSDDSLSRMPLTS
ncbi:MAG: GDP-mannose 4,6-dehydratase [Candidatus Binatus sp.]|uniref:NAD-dependent epimerase/dehydratase family protein n=1 Tax=Candidatus Binatus sp. TaxID=2811406 RepID=UPI0027244EAC|nr:NAD-dependent epimerase/dehydratase family protein [Candidatus Binatus sp.]MDO8432790.1 GDP-mannose 4,6-dehydratase [Candidatus Binatus sp.]